MGGHLEQVKPGLCVPWEVPSRGCLVLEIRISATFTSLGGGRGGQWDYIQGGREAGGERREAHAV